MILISIGAALALEHTMQTIHQRHLARQAAQRMETEIHAICANIAEIDAIGQHNIEAGK